MTVLSEFFYKLGRESGQGQSQVLGRNVCITYEIIDCHTIVGKSGVKNS